MRRPIARAGPVKTVVYAVCTNGSSPGYEFYKNELNDTEKAKMNALFNRMGEHGIISNRQKFKRIEGTDLFELKSHQIRMPCFFLAGGLVVITHGFKKKDDRIPPSEIDRADRIRQEDAVASSEPGGKNKWCN